LEGWRGRLREHPLSTALHTRPATNSGDLISAAASGAQQIAGWAHCANAWDGPPCADPADATTTKTGQISRRSGSKTCASPGIRMRTPFRHRRGPPQGGLKRSWSPCVSGREHDVLSDGANSVLTKWGSGLRFGETLPGSGSSGCVRELTSHWGHPPRVRPSPKSLFTVQVAPVRI